MSRSSYRLPLRMQAELKGRYLPLDRRDLQQSHVDHSLANFMMVCVLLGLWDRHTVTRDPMVTLARNLYRLVKRRHTHLWTLSLPPQA